jgi:hypothetical protein
MLRSTILVFIAGWIAWFWMDKGPVRGGMPMRGGGDDLLMDFQLAFDLLKRGGAEAAFAFIWPAHYIILSLVGGVLVSIAGAGVSRAVARARRRVRTAAKSRHESGPPADGR